jgi:NADH:ubiquinone oxidoreductase subunit 5 (subunit L)/multisubunit Na+/H+ antiporter MnhA subunit
MSKPNKEEKEDDGNHKRADSSIFYIMDGIIDQLNRTKKLFIIMILTIMIIPPIVFVLSFMLIGFPFHNDDDRSWMSHKQWGDNSGPSPSHDFNPSFRFLPLILVIVVIVWLGIGIRQWFVLSKWDKKYKKYKELQKKVDEELGKDDKSESK